ncbi:putative membrane-bound dehydrogenase domain-containing protein [Singulisphaera sp. GP187]|uniref:PVC-type heme-binding CxxCH protein n=1 Tax=Singulisphaera sp. GP187 TaxID=1882752 RepID=UPI000928CDDB|nr:PVC-type heme-binding CxxCH protein [Singulisphaera sp. GP187]SIO60378.1 putative membrane-bound dehydrogenase domain-containing protein [Singulisphaera sp. GP187]
MKRTWIFASSLVLIAAGTALAGDFPTPRNSEPDPGSAMPASATAASFRVPSGFRVNVFAAEPDVQNPIAMAWDARGRLWVAENYTYAERSQRFDLGLRDRVVIFEDADGDGRSDRRTVFNDDVQMLTSLELGQGGVWLLCPPQLLFIPDRNGDDVPDAAAEVVLDGFTVPAENYHNFANGLRWGPDGWLYGRCGASSPGRLGIPGTADSERIPMNGGLWRYHPAQKRFEALTHGTTNPWGHDWNEFGEAFFVNTVNGHLWHAVAGSHFVRPHTIDPNPRAYALIDQHADHWHWDHSKDWSDSRKVTGEHDRRGGGHAHSGAMIYLGDQWPAADRGKLFTLNFHGRRVNVERLDRAGSGYVGRHEPDRLFAADTWFRGIDLGYGPDGGVFVLDWSDTGECHDSTGVHRTSGRIYKITHGEPKRVVVGDLAKQDERSLVELHRHSNEWFVRTARRQLADRSMRGDRLDQAREALRVMLVDDPDPVRELRALWSLHAIGAADEGLLRPLLGHEHEAVRGWAIRLLTDRMPLDTVTSQRPGPVVALPEGVLDIFVRMAKEDRSGLVRLVLASTLQRLPVARRAELAAPLMKREEDRDDHNIPLLVWYGLIPVGDADPTALARLGAECVLPVTRRLIARRLAEDIEKNPAPLNELLARGETSQMPALQADIVWGVAEGLLGWRKAIRPAAWESFARRLEPSVDPAVRTRVRELNVLFGDGRALDEVKKLALDDKSDLTARRAALQTLIESRPPDLRSICERLLRVRHLNATAVRGLALFNDPGIGRSLAANYRSFHPSERGSVIDTLASRPAFALALLDQLAAGKIPRADLTPFHARQIRSLEDPQVQARLSEVWGEQRETASDKKAKIAHFKGTLIPSVIAGADRSQGRVAFNKVCASCHKLYGQGGEIGPDLTGAGRDNLDYLLENVVDPSAAVSADFRMVIVEMKDGRVLNGLVRSRTDRTLTLQTQTERLVLEHSEIEREKGSPLSLMPEGLLDPLTPDQIRDLIAYLAQRSQAPLPPGE